MDSITLLFLKDQSFSGFSFFTVIIFSFSLICIILNWLSLYFGRCLDRRAREIVIFHNFLTFERLNIELLDQKNDQNSNRLTPKPQILEHPWTHQSLLAVIITDKTNKDNNLFSQWTPVAAGKITGTKTDKTTGVEMGTTRLQSARYALILHSVFSSHSCSCFSEQVKTQWRGPVTLWHPESPPHPSAHLWLLNICQVSN